MLCWVLMISLLMPCWCVRLCIHFLSMGVRLKAKSRNTAKLGSLEFPTGLLIQRKWIVEFWFSEKFLMKTNSWTVPSNHSYLLLASVVTRFIIAIIWCMKGIPKQGFMHSYGARHVIAGVTTKRERMNYKNTLMIINYWAVIGLDHEIISLFPCNIVSLCGGPNACKQEFK